MGQKLGNSPVKQTAVLDFPHVQYVQYASDSREASRSTRAKKKKANVSYGRPDWNLQVNIRELAKGGQFDLQAIYLQIKLHDSSEVS